MLVAGLELVLVGHLARAERQGPRQDDPTALMDLPGGGTHVHDDGRPRIGLGAVADDLPPRPGELLDVAVPHVGLEGRMKLQVRLDHGLPAIE